MTYINIAFYHFFKTPTPLEETRVRLKRYCLDRGFLGTIILAPEGINLMISGKPDPIVEFQDYLREMIGAKDLFFKESSSDYLPFNRMLVKAKQQLIPVNHPLERPDMHDASHISPEQLKQWLDEEKDFVLLDTRNEFEFHIGTFNKAQQAKIENFRDFEETLKTLPPEWKEKPVVTFCTGGIRCEKAQPLMKLFGFKKVLQLHGGILNYFEKVGGDHYKGDCFVFDKRVALGSDLKETNVVECFNCRHPVTPEEQKLPSYEYEVSCPYCFDSRDPA